MKQFYRELFPFEILGESDTGLSFRPGNTLFSLRQRTRDYDGRGPRLDAPGVQLAFRVSPEEVDSCYEQLVARGVKIAENQNGPFRIADRSFCTLFRMRICAHL